LNPENSETQPKSSKMKTILFALLGAGVLTTAIGGGTLASFTATTTNPSNTFSNGSVSMTNVAGTVISGSNCSTSTSNGTCATLFGAGNAGTLKPSTTDVSNTATITYTGSASTSAFALYATNYTAKTGSSSALCTAPSSGAGNPGTALDLLVTVGSSSPALVYPSQNTTLSSALTSGNAYTTLSTAATTAAIASGAQLIVYSASLNNYQQVTTSAAVSSGATSIPVTSFTANASYGIGAQVAPQGTLDGFAATYTSPASGITLKGGTNGSGSAGVWANGDNAIYNIKVHLDNAAANSLQGCQSQSDIVWYAS